MSGGGDRIEREYVYQVLRGEVRYMGQKIPLGMQRAFYMMHCLLDEMGYADPNSVRWEIQTRWGLCTIELVFGHFTRHRSRPGNRWAQVTGLDLAPWWQPL